MTVLVDDHLALDVLAGRRPPGLDEPCATTYGFYVRLLTAAASERGRGGLSDARAEHAEDLLLDPPGELLEVVDPLAIASLTAGIKAEYGANLLVAEVGAAALDRRVPVRVSAGNVGRTWPGLFADLGVDFDVIGG